MHTQCDQPVRSSAHALSGSYRRRSENSGQPRAARQRPLQLIAHQLPLTKSTSLFLQPVAGLQCEEEVLLPAVVAQPTDPLLSVVTVGLASVRGTPCLSLEAGTFVTSPFFAALNIGALHHNTLKGIPHGDPGFRPETITSSRLPQRLTACLYNAEQRCFLRYDSTHGAQRRRNRTISPWE